MWLRLEVVEAVHHQIISYLTERERDKVNNGSAYDRSRMTI